MSTIEDLRTRMAVNDTKIADLEKDIKAYDEKIKAGEPLTPEQKTLHVEWRARLSELTQSNDKLSHEIAELSKPSGKNLLFYSW